jgi:hypothetical protein
MSIVCIQWSPHFQDIVLDDCFGFGRLAFINDEPFLYQALKKIQYKIETHIKRVQKGLKNLYGQDTR